MGVGTAERLERSVSIFGGTRWRLTEPSVCRHSSLSRWAGLFRAICGVSIILLLAGAASAMCNASLTLKLDRHDAKRCSTICWSLHDLDHGISVWKAVITIHPFSIPGCCWTQGRNAWTSEKQFTYEYLQVFTASILNNWFEHQVMKKIKFRCKGRRQTQVSNIWTAGT